eukprot:1195865-Prorocentrum_minimum.AAC.4
MAASKVTVKVYGNSSHGHDNPNVLNFWCSVRLKMKKGASRHQRPRRRKSEMLKSGQGRAGRSEGMSGYGVESCNNLHVVLLVGSWRDFQKNAKAKVWQLATPPRTCPPWNIWLGSVPETPCCFARCASPVVKKNHPVTSTNGGRQRSSMRHLLAHLGTPVCVCVQPGGKALGELKPPKLKEADAEKSYVSRPTAKGPHNSVPGAVPGNKPNKFRRAH